MLEQLSTNPFLYSLSLTLLHFLWQGLLVAIVLKSVLLIIDKSKSNLRYSASCVAMLSNLLLALATFIFVYPSQTERITNNLASIPLTSLVNEWTQQNSFFTYQELLPSLLVYSLPYLSMLWLISITALACKLLIEIRNVNQLPKYDHLLPNIELLARFNILAKKIQLKKTPKLLISLKIDVPMAIGWLKPVVLLPASMVTGLNSAQLEMLLLHELAHIRRYDYLVNFIQTLIEILFFFHPSVAWVAKQMRNEREYCSDDIAVQHCGDPIAYAHTLTDTASLCAKGHSYTIPSMAMAASGGDLKERVLRLVDHHCAPSNNISKWLAALSIVLTVGLIFTNQLLNKPLISNTFSKLEQSDWQYNSPLKINSNELIEGNSLDDLLLSTSLLNNKQYAYAPSIEVSVGSDIDDENNDVVNSIAQQLLSPNNNLEQQEITSVKSKKEIILNKAIDNQTKPNSFAKVSVELTTSEPASFGQETSTTISIANNPVKENPVLITTLIPKINKTENVTSLTKLSLAKLEQPLNVKKEILVAEGNDKTIVESTFNRNVLVAKQNSENRLRIENTQRKFKASTTVEDKVAKATKTIKSVNSLPSEYKKVESLNLLQADQSDELTLELTAANNEPVEENLIINDLYQPQLPSFTAQNIQNFDTINAQEADINTGAIWHSAKQLKSVDPVYPSLAKRKGIEIEVKVEFTIDEEGQVKDIKFAQQSRVNYFKSAIRAAIHKWRFLPAKKNEQAIESQMSKIFSFSLLHS